jgi:hypothetical protein
MNSTSMRPFCLLLSLGSILAGGVGMLLSFLHLGTNSAPYVSAGSAGFIAGAVLIGAGLVSLTMLATRPTEADPASNPFRIRDES